MSRTRSVIVVGAGSGGLAAALDLAARGIAVTLLERHAAVGGKMRQVVIDGQGIDAGPTVFTMRWVFDDLFDEAGERFEDHVSLTRADLLARHVWVDGTRLDLFSDIERSHAAITAAFGTADADRYREFAQASERIFETLDLSFMRAQRPTPMGLARRVGISGLPALLATKPFKTLWQDLQAHFHDERLAQLFARYATYCGSSPLAAPATLQLIAHAERAGVWYLDGGMQSLASAMADAITAKGGQVRSNTPVADLLHHNGRITGVRLENGEALTADAVIFNGDTAALADGLMGDVARRAVPALPRQRESLSAMTWNLRARTSGFPLAHHTVVFGEHYPKEFEAIFNSHDICAQPTVYICAQDRADEQARTDDYERLLVLINAPAGTLSESQVMRAEAAMFEMLERVGVSLDYSQTQCVRTLPEDFDSLFPATGGALYGRPTHGAFGTFARPGARAKLPGLYLAGGSVHPGAGVPMTAMSGRLAAACVRYDLGLS
ncbi:MAG: 1-hydroxycarotenoid 3,4-desaturase CrtD [Pseudomonadota bacterium]